MAWTELAPLMVGIGGIITALAAYFKVRHGEGNKRIDADLRDKEIRLQSDHQDNNQVMELVHFQQAMLDKHQARLDDLQYIMEIKAEQEAENRADLRLMRYRIAECEEDRTQLRRRLSKVEKEFKREIQRSNPPDNQDT